MPPRSPLPQRHGLDAAWMRTPDRDHGEPRPWATMGEWIHSRLHEFIDVEGFLADGRFVYEDGRAAGRDDPYGPHTFVWFHRDLSAEKPVPGAIHIVYRDDRIVVIDKPPFLASIPRGRHVRESVVVRLRDELGMPELSPLHRLDRVTSGLLMLATEKKWRAPYQGMFQAGAVQKTYFAQAPIDRSLALPVTVRNHLVKERGQMQGEVVPGVPANSESIVELISEVPFDEGAGGLGSADELSAAAAGSGTGIYRLTPRTGRTHQLRLHMNSLGIPICGDPLYPRDRQVSVEDFCTPLQLLAGELAFQDPVDGGERRFASVRSLPLRGEGVD